MNRLTSLFAAGIVSLALASGLALAQTPPPPSTQPPSVAPSTVPPTDPTAKIKKGAKTEKAPKPPKADKPAKVRSPESLACSAEANAKNLTGDPRKAFRKTCIADKRKTKI